MRSVDEQVSRILDSIQELPPFDQRLLDAHGCALCEDVTAGFDLPHFDNSAMDGYAVRAADVAGASAANPVTLPVAGDLAAGSTEVYGLAPDQTVRIMTGAVVPHGADAIVPVEWTDGGVATVEIRQAPEVGAFIRRRGEDVREGEHLLPAGTVLDARRIGLLAAVGRDTVMVRPRPRVVVLSTGSELREPGQPLVGEGLIYESNSYALAAAAREAGAIAYRAGIAVDDDRAFTDLLEDQLVRADIVVTSGGVSVGAYDIVKQVLSRLGTVEFTQVAMQPGKPQGFGVVGEDATPIFTLPGNPVSAYVSFHVFVKPALRKLVGATPYVEPPVPAVTTKGWRSSVGKRQYVRVDYSIDEDGRARITPVSGSGSHLMGGLARANALAIVPEELTDVPEGTTLDVMPL
ncbi:molybdopterin molybdotransferase MoeA [Flindersiella endophytica]